MDVGDLIFLGIFIRCFLATLNLLIDFGVGDGETFSDTFVSGDSESTGDGEEESIDDGDGEKESFGIGDGEDECIGKGEDNTGGVGEGAKERCFESNGAGVGDGDVKIDVGVVIEVAIGIFLFKVESVVIGSDLTMTEFWKTGKLTLG